jgi:prevent-host-death family protein
MKQMAAGTFKTHCLRLMDQVQATREPVLITKRGKPVAKLVPVGSTDGDHDVFGCLKGVMEIVGDIESPVVSPADWEILR